MYKWSFTMLCYCRYKAWGGISVLTVLKSLRSRPTWFDTSVFTLTRSPTSVLCVTVCLLWRVHWQHTSGLTLDWRSTSVSGVVNSSQHMGVSRFTSDYTQVCLMWLMAKLWNENMCTYHLRFTFSLCCDHSTLYNTKDVCEKWQI